MSKTPKNCITCSFQYPCNKGKTKYCTLGRFPILNPEVGCHRHMYKSEFKSSDFKHITPEEMAAYAEVTAHELKESGIKDPCAKCKIGVDIGEGPDYGNT